MEHDYEVKKFCVLYWLRCVRTMHDRIDEVVGRIRMIESRLTVVGVSFDSQPRSRNATADMVPDGLAELFDLREELMTRMAEGTIEYSHAADLCMATPGRAALWSHVVDERTWDYAARKVGYSASHVCSVLVPAAIRELYDAMPEQYRREAIPNAAPGMRP